MRLNRRVFMLQCALAPVVLAGGASARAADPMLSESEPKALEFHYKADSATVDAKAHPSWTSAQKCSACQLYEDGADGAGSCLLFPGKRVAAIGWCTSFN